MNDNLLAVIAHKAAVSAAPALRTPEGRKWSYGELLDQAGRVAALLAGWGVRPGDRVAVQVEKSPEALLLYLGCLGAGAAYLPLNPAYPPAEMEYYVGDAEPALLVADPQRVDALRPLTQAMGARLETLGPASEGSLPRALRGVTHPLTPVERASDDLAAILYTSGTTGRSKGAMLTHGNIRSNAEALVEAWRFTARDVLLHALPIFHTHGLFVASNVALLAGASMLLLPSFDADAVLEDLPLATVFMGVPTYYTRLLANPRLRDKPLAHMRLFTSGSAPLLASTHAEWEEATGHRILERYGMTETNMNTSNPYEGERRAGTVGFALPGVSVRVVEESSGEILPAGAVGMIEAKGANVFAGYWRMPEKTAAEFREDGFFITGDLGRFDDDGYLEIVGRDKDMIISGGLNVYPKEIEGVLDSLDGIAESAVFGVPHADFGEAVVVAIIPARTGEADLFAIRTALEEQLANYKIPKHFIQLDALPRNTMGKVMKNILRDRYANLFAA